MEVLVPGLAARLRCFTQQSAQSPHMKSTTEGNKTRISSVVCRFGFLYIHPILRLVNPNLNKQIVNAPQKPHFVKSMFPPCVSL